MYLSRLILDPRCNQVRHELADVYQLHRTILRAFPEELPDRERILFRVDMDRRTGVPALLVQSQTAPDWAFLSANPDYLLQLPPPEENPTFKPYNPSLARGQLLTFRLRANPTARRGSRDDKGKRKRLAWLREEEQRAWLERHAARGGFRLAQLTVIPEGMHETVKLEDKHTYHIRYFAARFEGLLQVTDPDQFLRTLAAGIGPAKAFGFGLLSVAPVR